MVRKLMIVSLLVVTSAATANPFGSLMLLIPVSPGRVAGAFGTDWITTAWLHNGSDVDLTIECGAVDLTSCGKVKAHTTMLLQNPYSSAIAPFFLRIPTGIIFGGPPINTVWVEERTIDTVSTPRSAGTEIPLAHPSDFRTGTTILPHVPINTHSRLRLRVYGLQNGTASVRGIGLTTNRDVLTLSLPLTGADTTLPSTRFPSYSEALLSTAIGNDDAMQLEISSTNAIWGFVTVTDNDTQQFTVISPATPEYFPISLAKLSEPAGGGRGTSLAARTRSVAAR